MKLPMSLLKRRNSSRVEECSDTSTESLVIEVTPEIDEALDSADYWPHFPQGDIKNNLPLNLACDPRLWNRIDVSCFLQWCREEYDLPSFDTNLFQMNGRALCLLSKEDLGKRCPGFGDLIFNILRLIFNSTVDVKRSHDLKKEFEQRDDFLPQNTEVYGHDGNEVSSSSMSNQSDSEGPIDETLANAAVNLSPRLSEPTHYKIPDTGSGNFLLWDFLRKLLNDPMRRYKNYIEWKREECGVFKIMDPPGLATLWGIQKNHLTMNYDKMSRALRYYYRVNILKKVRGEPHCYQFVQNSEDLKNAALLRRVHPYSVTKPVKEESQIRTSNVKEEPYETDY